MVETFVLVLVAIAIVAPLALGFGVMGAIMLVAFIGSFVAMIRSVFDEKWIRSRTEQQRHRHPAQHHPVQV